MAFVEHNCAICLCSRRHFPFIFSLSFLAGNTHACAFFDSPHATHADDSFNEWVHHWLLLASPFGITLKRSDIFFGNIYELVTFYCNTVQGSLLPCRLSLHRNQNFLTSERHTTATTTKRTITRAPPPPVRVVPPPVRGRHRRELVEEERRVRNPPRVVRRRHVVSGLNAGAVC